MNKRLIFKELESFKIFLLDKLLIFDLNLIYNEFNSFYINNKYSD